MLANVELKSKHFLIKPETKTKGGIYLPENVQAVVDSIINYPQQVVHASTDCLYKKDEYVLIEPHNLLPIKLFNEDYFLIADYRVLAKVNNYDINQFKPSVIDNTNETGDSKTLIIE